MATITKKAICHKIGQTHKVQAFITQNLVQAFLDEITLELAKGNRVEFRNFGVFQKGFRPARKGLNPRTLEKVNVPAKYAVKFKMSRKMALKLNQTVV